MFHHAMRGDTLSLLHWNHIYSIYDLWWSFGLTHPCSTTLWAPDHSTSIIMRQCKDKGHLSHPQEKPQSTSTGGRGEGGQDVYITLGGMGGACQTWIIYATANCFANNSSKFLWQFYVIAKRYGNMILLACFENLLISCSKACLWEKSHWHRTSALEIAALGDPRLLRRALSHSYCGFFPGGPSLCGASTQGHAPSQGFHLRVTSSGWMCAFRWHTQCVILCLSCRQKCYLPHPKNTENERNTCQVSKLWGDVTALYTYMLDQLRRRSSRSHQVWGIHALSQKYFVALDTQRRSVANPTAQKLICIWRRASVYRSTAWLHAHTWDRSDVDFACRA